tara:strand:- start:30 stop:335 length:306 start_codon:yes stop_codon:yes gene_type:complete
MFEKGISGNPAGRPKGSANKIASEIKEAFALTLQNKLPELEVLLARVAADDPAKALDLMLKLSNRFLPELSRQEVTGADGEDLFKNLKFNFGLKPDVEDGE